jgi:Methyltransferase FkbM domain
MLTARSLLRLVTPPYLFQPLQVVKRLRLEYFWRSRREACIALPWGLPIKIDTNRGTSWTSEQVESGKELRYIEVPLRNLDEVLDETATIGVMKMDVQGQELNVLRGAAGLLKRHAVRDIVFEEETLYPAPTHEYLKSFGYAVFGIAETFSGVRLVLNGQSPFDPEFGPIPNYLATADPKRAIERLKPAMWRSFGPGRLFTRL